MDEVTVLAEGETPPENTFVCMGVMSKASSFGFYQMKDEKFDLFKFVQKMNDQIQQLKNKGWKSYNNSIQIIEKKFTDDPIYKHDTIGWKGYFTK